MGRRLNRLLVALIEAISRSDKPVGAGAGSRNRSTGQLEDFAPHADPSPRQCATVWRNTWLR